MGNLSERLIFSIGALAHRRLTASIRGHVTRSPASPSSWFSFIFSRVSPLLLLLNLVELLLAFALGHRLSLAAPGGNPATRKELHVLLVDRLFFTLGLGVVGGLI